MDLGAEPAAERPEHVAPHADRRRNEHEQSGQGGERAGDRAEGDAGDEIAARGDQERDETRADPGEVRTYERDEARAETTREETHDKGLGGSAITIFRGFGFRGFGFRGSGFRALTSALSLRHLGSSPKQPTTLTRKFRSKRFYCSKRQTRRGRLEQG